MVVVGGWESLCVARAAALVALGGTAPVSQGGWEASIKLMVVEKGERERMGEEVWGGPAIAPLRAPRRRSSRPARRRVADASQSALAGSGGRFRLPRPAVLPEDLS